MRYICTRCKQTSPDGHLWCQEIDCPAGTLPALLNFGDYLGNIAIVRLLRVTRTAAIYVAERGKDRFLLKVANYGYTDYLRHEGELLKILASRQVVHPALPTLCPPELDSSDPCGVSVFRGETRHYLLLGYFEGQFLSDVLLDNPEPWHYDVGWFMLTLAQAIDCIHKNAERLHLNLHPDGILVYRNSANIMQPYLVDLGLCVEPYQNILPDLMQNIQRNVPPSYAAPEMFSVGSVLTPGTDVHGLGILYYEMLAGSPAFAYRLRKETDIRQAVKVSMPAPLKRPDLPGGRKNNHKPPDDQTASSVVICIEMATHRNPSQRYQTVNEFREAVHAIYHDVPEKRRFALSQRARLVLVAVLAVIVLVIVLLVILSLTTAVGRGSF